LLIVEILTAEVVLEEGVGVGVELLFTIVKIGTGLIAILVDEVKLELVAGELTTLVVVATAAAAAEAAGVDW